MYTAGVGKAMNTGVFLLMQTMFGSGPAMCEYPLFFCQLRDAGAWT